MLIRPYQCADEDAVVALWHQQRGHGQALMQAVEAGRALMQAVETGRALMQAVETGLLALGCPKINLQVRATNSAVLAFYQRLGYANDEVVSLGKRLIPDQSPAT